MAKKARLNPTIQPSLAKISKRTGRSSGSLVEGLFGQKVTPKVLKAQQKNRESRNNKR